MEKSDNILNSISIKVLSIIKQFLIICLYLLLSVIMALSCNNAIISNNIILSNVSSIFVDLSILTIFILIFRKTIIPDYYDFQKNGKSYLKKYWYYWLIGLVVMIISNTIIGYYIGLPSNEEANRGILFQMPIYAVVAMVIFAPITEELMTRVMLNKAFKNPYIYAIISGIIFGSLHLMTATSKIELFYIIPYSALGIAFSLIYCKSNNIWTNIFFHSLHNFIALALIFIGG